MRRYHDSSLAAEPGLDPATAGGVIQDDTGNQLTDAELKVAFDSTHFPHGTQIPIEFRVWDSTGNYNKSILSAPAYNYAVVLANHTANNLQIVGYTTDIPFGSSCIFDVFEHISGKAAALNLYPETSMFYDVNSIKAALPKGTVFYDATHGGPSDFFDCNYGLYTELDLGKIVLNRDKVALMSNHDVSSTDVWNAVASKYPLIPPPPIPYDPTDPTTVNPPPPPTPTPVLPPYNFVDLDVCKAAKNFGDPINLPRSFLDERENSKVFGPQKGVQIGPGSDRALIGFADNLVIDYDNSGWTEVLWDHLADGFTLMDSAIMASIDNGQSEGEKGVFTLIYPVIVGDPAMRLHGVYQTGPSASFDDDLPKYLKVAPDYDTVGKMQWFAPL